MSTTGIPVEWLFGVLGSLIALIYLDLRREVRILRKESQGRAVVLSGMRQILATICKKLDFPFELEKDNGP